MTLKHQLQFVIRHMETHKTYKSLSLFVDENANEIANLTDEKELKDIITLLLHYTNLANCCWLENETIKNTKSITNIILNYIMKEDIYGVSPITYSDFLCSLNLDEYPEDFCKSFLEKNLETNDILIIESILYKIDGNDKAYYKQMQEKYKDKKYTAIELTDQLKVILHQENFGFIKDNIDYLLKIYPINSIKTLYTKLKKHNLCVKEIENYIIENLDEILDLNMDNIEEIIAVLDKDSLLYNKISNYIKENMETIIKLSKERTDIYDIKSTFDNFDDIKPLIKDYINNNKDEVIDKLYSYVVCFFINNDYDSVISTTRNNVKEVLKLIIEEICSNENVNFSDIEKVGEGAFSKVYRINNKVLKLGIFRDTMKIPKNPYNIKPLIRRSFNIDGKNNGESLFIEVTEYAKTLPKNMNIEDQTKILYDLYKKQRDIGIEWRDVKIDNVGILTKDNIHNWPNSLGESCDAYGLIDNKYADDIVLKEGDYVVIDGDLQYTEEEFIEKYLGKLDMADAFNEYWIMFYMKYNEEHRENIRGKLLQK